MHKRHRTLLLGIFASLLLATPAGADDARSRTLRELRVATDDYAKGALDSAWFRFWTLAREGSAAAQFNLAQLYRQGQGIPTDLVQARQWYEAAARQGYAYAQYNLGTMCEYGHGGVPADTEEALRWYRRAAAQNLEQAQKALHRLEAKLGTGTPVAQVQRPAPSATE